MSRLPDALTARVGIPLVVVTALGGCMLPPSGAESGHERTSIEYCFDGPFQSQPPLEVTGANREVMHLDYNPSTRTVNQERTLHPAVLKTVIDANVTVVGGGRRGSGVLIAPDLVLTAAHVVAVDDLDAILVRDVNGEEAYPVDACIVSETDGTKTASRDRYEGREPSTPQANDLAILRLGKPLGRSMLQLAPAFPARGTWVTFVNSQLAADKSGTRFTAENPAVYDGVVVSNKPGLYGRMIITGMQPRLGAANGARESASGGVIVDEVGNVVAISVVTKRVDRDSLKVEYGVKTNTDVGPGSESGLDPFVVYVVPVEDIRQALTSDRYRNADMEMLAQ